MWSMTPKAAELARCAEYCWGVCSVRYSTTLWGGWTLSQRSASGQGHTARSIYNDNQHLFGASCFWMAIRYWLSSSSFNLTRTYCSPICMMLNLKSPFSYGGIDWLWEHDVVIDEVVVKGRASALCRTGSPSGNLEVVRLPRLWYFYPVVVFALHICVIRQWPLS